MPVQKLKCVLVTSLQNLDPINMKMIKKLPMLLGIKLCFVLLLKIFSHTNRWNFKMIPGLVFLPMEFFTAWIDIVPLCQQGI